MTEEKFKLGFAALVNIFTSARIEDATRDIYWQVLREIPDDLWEAGVERSLRTRKFFPAPVEIAEDCLEGHLYEYFPNRHIYIEPKKLEWTVALARVLKKRQQPTEIEAKAAEVLPPPTKREAKRILIDFKPKFRELDNTPAVDFVEAAVDPEKRAREEKQREERVQAARRKIQEDLKLLETQEAVKGRPLDQKEKHGDPEWIH
jgi:hypothetical protein